MPAEIAAAAQDSSRNPFHRFPNSIRHRAGVLSAFVTCCQRPAWRPEQTTLMAPGPLFLTSETLEFPPDHGNVTFARKANLVGQHFWQLFRLAEANPAAGLIQPDSCRDLSDAMALALDGLQDSTVFARNSQAAGVAWLYQATLFPQESSGY